MLDALAYSLSVMVMGVAVSFFDGRIFNGFALLPPEQYQFLVTLMLALLYLCFAWSYLDLIPLMNLPIMGLTVGWIGFSWYLVSRHLQSPEAQEHLFSWTANHLILTGSFFTLLAIEGLLVS